MSVLELRRATRAVDRSASRESVGAVRALQGRIEHRPDRFSVAGGGCIKPIAAAPRLRPKMLDCMRRANVPRFPSLILYAEKPGAVQGVVIMHARRHPDAWASRELGGFDAVKT